MDKTKIEIKNTLVNAGVYSFIIGSVGPDEEKINFIILSKNDVKKLIKIALKIIYRAIRCNYKTLSFSEIIEHIIPKYKPIDRAITIENLGATINKFSSEVKISVIDSLKQALEKLKVNFSEKENNFMEGISLVNTINNLEDFHSSTIRGIKPFNEIVGGLPLEKIFSNSNQWTVGTIGLIKHLPDSTIKYLVSNFHVLCEDYYIEDGEYVFSPNANTLDNKIGAVPRQININLFKEDASKINVDLAIGVIEDDENAITDATLVNENPNIYVKLDSNLPSPVVGINDIFYKYGGRTNLTSGKVVAKNCYAQFEYPGMGILSFDNLLTMSSGCHKRPFALPGDSGSIVFDSPFKEGEFKSKVAAKKFDIQKKDFHNTQKEAIDTLYANLDFMQELGNLIDKLDSIPNKGLNNINKKIIAKIIEREDKIEELIKHNSCCKSKKLLKELKCIKCQLLGLRIDKKKIIKKVDIFNTINDLAKKLNGIEGKFRSILEEYDYPGGNELKTSSKPKIIGMVFGGTFNTLGFSTNSLFPTESNYVLVQPWAQIKDRLENCVSLEKIIATSDKSTNDPDDDSRKE